MYVGSYHGFVPETWFCSPVEEVGMIVAVSVVKYDTLQSLYTDVQHNHNHDIIRKSYFSQSLM